MTDSDNENIQQETDNTVDNNQDFPEIDDFSPADEVSENPVKAAGSGSPDYSDVIRAALDRANRVEQDLADLRRTSSAPTEEQRQRMEEDRMINDPDADPAEKWRIQQNRIIRESWMNSQRANLEMQDMKDRYNFMSKMSSDPRRSKYQERIEKEVESQRANGRFLDRETAYYYLLGKDIADGKYKSSAKKQASAASVPRGKPVQARGDVSSSGRSKSGLREKLENLVI